MPAPTFDPQQLDALARIFAEAALEELLREAEAQQNEPAAARDEPANG